MTNTPIRQLLDAALGEFERAMVAQKVYDADHPNLRRAYLGAEDFVKFLTEGPSALAPVRQGRHERERRTGWTS